MTYRKEKRSRTRRGYNRRLGDKRRGAGGRGGRGRAGFGKRGSQRMSSSSSGLGKRGFVAPCSVELKNVNVRFLDEMSDRLIASGKAKKEGDAIVIDVKALGYDKVGGSGQVRKKLVLSNGIYSKKAKEKVESAGGKCL